MSEQATNEFARIFLSVIAGMLTAIAVGALLLPLVEVLLDKYSFYFSSLASNLWKGELIFRVALFGWLFIASVAGGFVCSLISTNKEIIQILINSLVTIVLISILSKGEILKPNQLLPSLLILTAIPLGNLFGGWLGGCLKRKRKSSVSIS